MSRSYAKLNNYSQVTLTRENRQDTSMSKCMGGLCAMKPDIQSHDQQHNQTNEHSSNVEQYGGFSLRAAIRPPYSNCWGKGGGDCSKKSYPAVS